MKYFYPANILLPKKDFEKWAVIACDQYTSDPEYWEDVKNIVGDSPSALNIMLPEIYIGQDDAGRIQKINENMQAYLDNGVFEEHKNAMIYVERKVGDKVRKGLVGVIDLEDYDYHKDSKTMVRATEETIEDRLPPRIQIRKDAVLEMPHVLLLLDDPTRSVVKPLESRKSEFETAYDFDLMKDGGHIHGWFLPEEAVQGVQDSLEKLLQKGDELLFVVGDGNHSLAAAKECYEASKNPRARYALVEIENVHDKSIEFEPIYRVLFNVDEKDFIEKFVVYTEEYGTTEMQDFQFFAKDQEGILPVKATASLPIGTLQAFIDIYKENHPEMKVDYIHGSEVVEKLSRKENTLGFIYEGLTKEAFFPAIRSGGSLPRKTFSMGHADDKRFYIETRRIQ